MNGLKSFGKDLLKAIFPGDWKKIGFGVLVTLIKTPILRKLRKIKEEYPKRKLRPLVKELIEINRALGYSPTEFSTVEEAMNAGLV